jgi:hypothetical protein
MRAPGVALVMIGAAACKAAPAEPAGIGAWDVTRTRLHDATGHCEPTDLPDGRKGTWCYMQPALTVGGQSAQVDLYFGGRDPDAALIELQLKVPACNSETIDAWARTSFGAPYKRGGGRAFWKNRYLYLAVVPDGSRCLVRVLPLSEQAELDRIDKAAP